jgi:hypothetical protein
MPNVILTMRYRSVAFRTAMEGKICSLHSRCFWTHDVAVAGCHSTQRCSQRIRRTGGRDDCRASGTEIAVDRVWLKRIDQDGDPWSGGEKAGALGPCAVSEMQNNDSDVKLAQETEGTVDRIDADRKQARGAQASKRGFETVSPLRSDPQERRADHRLALSVGFLDTGGSAAFTVLTNTCSK